VDEAKELVAKFSGKETLDKFVGTLQKLIEKVEKEEKVKSFLSEIKELFLNPKKREKLSKEEIEKGIKDIATRARQMVEQHKYEKELRVLLDLSDEVVNNVLNDEFLSEFRKRAGRVASDFSIVDSEGNMKLDMGTLDKLRSVIVPVLTENFKHIPISRIESNDEYREYWIDNIVLSGYNIIPDNIRIQIESDAEVDVRNVETKHSDTRLVVFLRNINTEFKNMDFYYKRKTFPEITEKGRVSLGLPGKGASLSLSFRIEQNQGSAPSFVEGSSIFQIHNLRIDFDKGSLTHKVLVPMITGIFEQQIKRSIEVEVEKSVKEWVSMVGNRLEEVLVQLNTPFYKGMDVAKKIVKGVGQDAKTNDPKGNSGINVGPGA